MQTLMTMTWSQLLMAIGLILVCGFLMLVVLVQRGRGGGLVGAFGGAGGMSAFGAKTGDVFTVITIVFAGVFVVLSVLGNYMFDQSQKTVASTTSTTNPTVVPAELDPETGMPAALPKDAIPLTMPPGTPGQTQTIKLTPGANGGVQALPVNTPPQPDPAVTPIQPNQVPPPAGTTGGQPAATPPATAEPKPADAGTKPAEAPKTGEKPAAEKPKEDPK